MNGEEPYISQERVYKLIKQAHDYAHLAYKASEMEVKQEYLANLKGVLGTLTVLYDPEESELEKNSLREDPKVSIVDRFLGKK